MFSLLFIRYILPGRHLIDTGKGELSKKPEHFYYLTCNPHDDCPEKMIKVFGNEFEKKSFIIRRDLYVAYITRDEARNALRAGIKIQKLPKRDKLTYKHILNTTNQYIALIAPGCKVPYRHGYIGDKGLIFESNESVSDVLTKVSKIPCVRMVEQLPPTHLNTRFNRNLAQYPKQDWGNKTLFKYSTVNKFSDKGLGGHGQIVSISDTGLDAQLCWFKDPDQDVPTESFNAMDHRKILTYFRYADDKDGRHGHGTFIAGIIAGQAVCPDDDDDDLCPGTIYDGVAPYTRIIVNDLFREGSDLIHWPGNGTDVFLYPRYMSSAVQYHAFDFQSGSIISFAIDWIQYYMPQMLLLFSAGDHGRIQGSKIPSPGDCKNVLTVGALYPEEFGMNQYDESSPVYVIYNNNTYLGYCDPAHGTTVMDLTSRHDYLPEGLTFPIGESEKEVFIAKEETDISSKELCAAVIVFGTTKLTGKIKRPVIRLPTSAEVDFNTDGDIKFDFYYGADERHLKFGISNLHDTTIRGPVSLARYKPEVVMPGGPVWGPDAGNREGETCGNDGVRLGEGTSVAAAFAAGDMMIIRQYLKHGWYPRGEKNKDEVIKSSNHMLRCIMAGISDPVKGHPDGVGFGRPRLERFIILPQDYNHTKGQLYGYRLFRKTTNKGTAYEQFDFTPQEDGEMNVTMAWNDPPHDPWAPSDVLFRLDLRVEDSEGSPVRVGNRKAEEFAAFDAHNTCKRIDIKCKKGVTYHVFVLIHDIVYYNRVNYTLLITAPFDHFDDNQAPKQIAQPTLQPRCPNTCEGSGTCENGFCVCPEDRFGDMCQSELRKVDEDERIEEDPFQQYEWSMYEFTVSKWGPQNKLVIELTHTPDANVFWMFSINEPPTWHHTQQSKFHHDFVILENSKIILDYPHWDFLETGDRIIFAVYSLDPKDIAYQIKFSELSVTQQQPQQPAQPQE
ncbi:hypothetical protein TVAG_148910 [Trichomonas vaginalis G3]|uniref:Peptidase S8/S53 domain-containing protein n=1 Tax=Trichomonas vaginalis (strain ATCC PRA-98 / G3) TaxID=412133 RepID=A2FEN6_TRIV3|nr:peptidase S8 family [Trichomonas vaginalis G3]EAX96616.1 hypothetical protein TVAG_148910 [Trichomonas vaginalis G3]KAI5532909.1 peptidase S8 family [Trichomonas vaginalis G3]|eukprot:XP_001309546.1 hypothetical protein [Trichomonas vaginalis G3]